MDQIKISSQNLVAIHNLQADKVEDYQVPFAIKNISNSEVTILVTYGTKDTIKGSYNLGKLAPTTLMSPNNLYTNTLTLGGFLTKFGMSDETTMNVEAPTVGVFATRPDGTKGTLVGGGSHNHAILGNPNENRLSLLHYVVLPDGNIVRVPQLLSAGGIVTMDHYIIQPNISPAPLYPWKVTKEDGACDAKCFPPAGKTPTIDSNANLVWQ